MERKVTVVVVDDHPLFREGVVHVLRANEDFDVIGEGATADEAVHLVADFAPDVLLLDMNLPGGGQQAVARIAATGGRTNVMMLTVVDHEESIAEAIKNGARGYLLKGTGRNELVESVKVVARGDLYVTPQLMGMLIGRISNGEQKAKPVEFTEREGQVLDLLSQGLSNKQIAFQLSLSEKTVKYYLTHVLRKLNVRNRVAAALYISQRRVAASGDGSDSNDCLFPPRR